MTSYTFYTHKDVGMIPLEPIVLVYVNDTSDQYELVVHFDKQLGKIPLDSLTMRFKSGEYRDGYLAALSKAVDSVRGAHLRVHKRRRASDETDDSS